MQNFTVLQKTIAVYCGDLLDDIEVIPGFAAEAGRMRVTAESAKFSDYNREIVEDLCGQLRRISEKMIGIFSRSPELSRMETLYVRTNSIKDMCLNIIDKRKE